MYGAVAGNRCENTPGLEISDRALDWGAQPVYLCVEFFLPFKKFTALRLLERVMKPAP
jgi:hypothetical protein